MTRNVANMLRRSPQRAKQILYDLCLQVDESINVSSEDEHAVFFEEGAEEEEDVDERIDEEREVADPFFQRLGTSDGIKAVYVDATDF